MIRSMRKTHAALLSAMFAAALASFPIVSSAAAASPQQDAATEAASRLHKSQFKDVKVSVDNGIATLTGSVSLYEYKADAGKRVLKAKGVTAVRDLIEVAGPAISDGDLANKLREKLAYDRVGWGNEFNSILIGVENGVVTVGGHARTDVDKDSALALVATTPGVKDVIGDIDVDPTSMMDDRIRIATARAIYDYPVLQKYAMDPAKPIRIQVANGNVTLYGVVNSTGDRDIAILRANGVPGVFSVKSYLLVAGQPAEAPK